VGVIFAGGPRHRTPEEAAHLLEGIPASTRRVGVFADQSPDEIQRIARIARLDVVQLHAASSPDRVRQVKRVFDGAVWAVVRLAAEDPPFDFSNWFEAADAVLVDAKVPGVLGGTGVALPWARLRASIERARCGRRLVVAGGLTPDNVAAAIAALSPNVVDVSSGVESAVGVKHHARMSEFVESVRGAEAPARVRTGESVRT